MNAATGRQPIRPERVTKPIQLLAAWLVGLIVIDGSFLTAANLLQKPDWAPAVLVLAAVANVPLFLVCLFLLQTRFRAQLQEDVYYSKYLERQTVTGKFQDIDSELLSRTNALAESNTKSLAVLDSFQTQLAVLADGEAEVQRLAQTRLDAELVVEQRKEYIHAVELTSGAIRDYEFGTVTLQINDLLPFYAEIRRDLERAGFKIADTFGSTSSKPNEVSFKVISFSPGVPARVVRTILNICQRFEFQGIDYADPQEFPTYGTVYIGSYSFQHGRIARLDESLTEALTEADLSEEELRDLVVLNSTHDAGIISASPD